MHVPSWFKRSPLRHLNSKQALVLRSIGGQYPSHCSVITLYRLLDSTPETPQGVEQVLQCDQELSWQSRLVSSLPHDRVSSKIRHSDPPLTAWGGFLPSYSSLDSSSTASLTTGTSSNRSKNSPDNPVECIDCRCNGDKRKLAKWK